MTEEKTLPRLDDLPIPDVVRVGKGWSPQMIEMADHIGPRAVLLICEHLGGQVIVVPSDPTRGKLAPVIGAEASAVMSRVYRREKIQIPTGRHALSMARRAGVIAAVRAGTLTGNDAARILGTARRYLSKLLSDPEEGTVPEGQQPFRIARQRDPRQIELFEDEEALS